MSSSTAKGNIEGKGDTPPLSSDGDCKRSPQQSVTQLKVERRYPTRVSLKWNLYTDVASKFASGEYTGVSIAWRCSNKSLDGSATLTGLAYSHTIPDLHPGTVVFAEVRIIDASSNSPVSPGAVVKTTTPLFLKPPKITNAQATAASVAVEWNLVDSASDVDLDVFEYEIELIPVCKYASDVRRVFTGADTTAFALTRLLPNTPYKFRVRAHYTFWRHTQSAEFEHLLVRTLSDGKHDDDAYDANAAPNTIDSRGMIVSEFSEPLKCTTLPAGVIWKSTAGSPLICYVGTEDDEETLFENPMVGGDYTLMVKNVESSGHVCVTANVFRDEAEIEALSIGPLFQATRQEYTFQRI